MTDTQKHTPGPGTGGVLEQGARQGNAAADVKIEKNAGITWLRDALNWPVLEEMWLCDHCHVESCFGDLTLADVLRCPHCSSDAVYRQDPREPEAKSYPISMETIFDTLRDDCLAALMVHIDGENEAVDDVCQTMAGEIARLFDAFDATRTAPDMAAEIERLRAVNEKMREALEEICRDRPSIGRPYNRAETLAKARAALEAAKVQS